MTNVIGNSPIMPMRFGSPAPSQSAVAHTEKSLAWFRRQLNERAWPKPITSAQRFDGGHAARMARRSGLEQAKALAAAQRVNAKRRAKAKLTEPKRGPRADEFYALDQERARQDRKLQSLRSMYPDPDEHASPAELAVEQDRGYYHNGWPTSKPGSVRPAPSDRRPMSAHVIWSEWLRDGLREIVLVAAPTGRARVVTTLPDGTHVARKAGSTDYWLTLAEPLQFQVKQYVPMVDRQGRPVLRKDRVTDKMVPRYRYSQVDTDAALADLNARYLGSTAPLIYVVDSWRVLEPVEEAMGPFPTEDAAFSAMQSWKSELDDDYADNHDRGSGLRYVD